MRRLRLVAVACLVVAGCAFEQRAEPTIAIDVAPLSLAGVIGAAYTLTVTNGVDEVVWTRPVTSGQHGDGAGSISYVGTRSAEDPARLRSWERFVERAWAMGAGREAPTSRRSRS